MRSQPIICHRSRLCNAVQYRNIQKKRANALRAPAAPEPPVVAGGLLSGAPINFVEFVTNKSCQEFREALFAGKSTSAGTMLEEFERATDTYYYGHRRAKPGSKPPLNPGMLTEDKAANKKLIKRFARLAYRGDPDLT